MYRALRRQGVGQTLPVDIDALLITDPVNVRYLTGLVSSNAAVLVRRDGSATLATDGRYLGQAERVADVPLVSSRAPAHALLDAAARSGTRVGIEAESVSVAQLDRLARAVATVSLESTSGLVEAARTVKDETEIAALRQACAITDQAFAAILDQIHSGITERDLAWLLETAIHEHGGEALAFDSIVAFGENSAIPHHEPTDRACQDGDLITLDFGARYEGYHADMTRTLILGRAAQWQQELYDVVREIQAECSAAVTVDAQPAALDRLATDRIESAGYEVQHGLGHGVGLAIHEDPFLTPRTQAGALTERTVLTVEPGIYLAGRGGVRIEDTVVVTDSGAESLTITSRELISCG